MPNIYVVQAGCYSDRYIDSIHSSIEKAQAYYPNETWSNEEQGRWNNTKDWSELLCIVSMEVDPEEEKVATAPNAMIDD